MIYTVILLICLSGMAPRECQIGNAVDVVFPPEPQLGLGACAIYGQQYAAESHLVIPGKTWPKIFCVPPTSIGQGSIG